MTSAVSDPDPANNGATDSTDVVEAATPALLIGRARPDSGIGHQTTAPPLGQSADPATMGQ